MYARMQNEGSSTIHELGDAVSRLGGQSSLQSNGPTYATGQGI